MVDSAGEALVVRSRPTREDRVSRIGPVELFRSRERIVTFIGTDVSRTAGPELHGKIVQRSTKDQSRPEVAISLPPDALVKLLETLTSIDAVREAGTVVVVPADTETPLGLLQHAVERLVAKPEILRELDADALTQLDSGLHQMRRLATMREALAQLDDLLESGVVAESRYQAWCARNGWAFGIEYDSPDEIRSIAAEDHVDMLLPRLTGYRDVIELKRPDASPIAEDKDRGTWYWTNAASRAISQGLRYTEKLAKAAEHGLEDHPEILAYYPLASIVMGRSANWGPSPRRWMVRVNASLHGVQVMTYDDLRARAARMLQVVSEG